MHQLLGSQLVSLSLQFQRFTIFSVIMYDTQVKQKKMIILIKHDAGIFFSILKESLRLQGNGNQQHCPSDYSINCEKRKLCFQNHESTTCLNKLKL